MSRVSAFDIQDLNDEESTRRLDTKKRAKSVDEIPKYPRVEEGTGDPFVYVECVGRWMTYISKHNQIETMTPRDHMVYALLDIGNSLFIVHEQSPHDSALFYATYLWNFDGTNAEVPDDHRRSTFILDVGVFSDRLTARLRGQNPETDITPRHLLCYLSTLLCVHAYCSMIGFGYIEPSESGHKDILEAARTINEKFKRVVTRFKETFFYHNATTLVNGVDEVLTPYSTHPWGWVHV